MNDAVDVARADYAVSGSRENCANVADVTDGADCADNTGNLKDEIYEANADVPDFPYCADCGDGMYDSESLETANDE